MSVFSAPSFDSHEHVVFGHDPETGLKAIIAVHNTNLGPGVGGCRMWPYDSDAAALEDVLRLSRGMTYKSALANLPFGGGKSVIIGDSRRDKTPELLRAMGRLVGSLGGRYVLAEDVGTTVEDMDVIAEETEFVACTSDGSGNPSPYTALGVYRGICAAVSHRMRRNAGLEGMTVALQGLGQVGHALARYLHEDGARLKVADISTEAVERAADEMGATPVAPDEIYGAEADVFAPCALGAIINDNTIGRLKAGIVAGSANNQLAENRHGAELARRGILYAPDYVINAGGIIEVALDKHKDPELITQHVTGIQETLTDIFRRADKEHLPTNVVADRLAEKRFHLRAAA
ncbi:MAG: Glu/Leu/Phe/Val dehydrogenase dimerization domain-containing protein [Alphaproteobacteria bacterium]